MTNKTEIIEVETDKLFLMMDFLYTPIKNEIKHEFYNDGRTLQTYEIVDMEDTIKSLAVIRKIYIRVKV